MRRQRLPSLAQRSFSAARPRCAAGPVRWPTRAMLSAFCGPQSATIHWAQALPTVCAGCWPGAAAAGATRGAPLFYPLTHQFGNRHACHPREPNNAALRVAPAQQGVGLCVVGGFARCRRPEQVLVAARRALVLGRTLCTAVATNRRAAGLGAKILRVNHSSPHGSHSIIDHRHKFYYVALQWINPPTFSVYFALRRQSLVDHLFVFLNTLRVQGHVLVRDVGQRKPFRCDGCSACR